MKLAGVLLLSLASVANASSYYLTKTAVPGTDALQACDNGFHMASALELQDLSDLRYDVARGLTEQDSGSGPPAGDSGWIRTGRASSQAITVGVGNCSSWTATTGAGTILALAAGAGTQLSTRDCAAIQRVWCAGEAQNSSSETLHVFLSIESEPVAGGPPVPVEAEVLDSEFLPKAGIELLFTESSDSPEVHFETRTKTTGSDGKAMDLLFAGTAPTSFYISIQPVGGGGDSLYIQVQAAPRAGHGSPRSWTGLCALLVVLLAVSRSRHSRNRRSV